MKIPSRKTAALLVIALGFLTALIGCTGGSGPVAILASPVVSGGAPLDVAFDLSYSVHPQGHPMEYRLDFGDASPPLAGTDFDLILHHTYTEGGSYDAVLTVTDGDGKQDVDRLEITVSQDGPPIGVEVGLTAPDFTAHTTDGGEMSLYTYRGRVILLDFWGAWCPPCRASMPHLDHFARAYEEDGLVVVIVSTDPAEQDSIDFLLSRGFDAFVSVWEPGGKSGNVVAQMYGVSSGDVGIPRTYVIDRQGVIRHILHPIDLTEDLVESLL